MRWSDGDAMKRLIAAELHLPLTLDAPGSGLFDGKKGITEKNIDQRPQQGER